jgi:hypothetical protein
MICNLQFLDTKQIGCCVLYFAQIIYHSLSSVEILVCTLGLNYTIFIGALLNATLRTVSYIYIYI